MIPFRFAIPAAAVTLLACLAGCTTSDKPVDLGGGQRGYRIVCSGLPISTASDCDDRARRICGANGYNTIKTEDPPYAHNEHAWSSTTHDITIMCNSSAPQPQYMPQQPEPAAPSM